VVKEKDKRTIGGSGGGAEKRGNGESGELSNESSPHFLESFHFIDNNPGLGF
jgi:hypothetical protein